MFYSQKNDLSKNLSLFIQEYLCLEDKTNNRLAKSIKDKYITDNISANGCIVEVGFLSNLEEERKLNNDSYQSLVAYCIYLGILTYLEVN